MRRGLGQGGGVEPTAGRARGRAAGRLGRAFDSFGFRRRICRTVRSAHLAASRLLRDDRGVVDRAAGSQLLRHREDVADEGCDGCHCRRLDELAERSHATYNPAGERDSLTPAGTPNKPAKRTPLTPRRRCLASQQTARATHVMPAGSGTTASGLAISDGA